MILLGETLNLNIATTRVVVDLASKGAVDTVTVQADANQAYPWTAAVVTLKRSNDGFNYVGLQTAATLTAAGMSNAIDVRGYRYLAAEVTTAEGAASEATITMYGNAYGR